MERFVKLVFIIMVNFFLVAPSWSGEGSAKQGKIKYEAQGCNACHGETGKGDGPAAMALDPRPPNFCTSTKHHTDAGKMTMIRDGGAKMGHSPLMPAYGDKLSEKDIRDIIAYINSLCQ